MKSKKENNNQTIVVNIHLRPSLIPLKTVLKAVRKALKQTGLK